MTTNAYPLKSVTALPNYKVGGGLFSDGTAGEASLASLLSVAGCEKLKTLIFSLPSSCEMEGVFSGGTGWTPHGKTSTLKSPASIGDALCRRPSLSCAA